MRVQEALKDGLIGRAATENDRQLLELASKCSATGLALQQEVQKIAHTDLGDSVNAMTRMFRSMRLASTIEKLRARLLEYQRMLKTRILVSLYASTHTLATEKRELLDNQDINLRHFVTRLANGFTKLEDLARLESMATRDHISSEVNATHQLLTNQLSRIEGDVSSDREQSQRKALRESFAFPEILLRQDQIADAFAETFEFMFTLRPDGYLEDSFIDWLHSDRDLFWISGKAGSGKSTPVNFLSQDPRTSRYPPPP